MPASDFSVTWSQNVPLFQVCGTKRKHEQESSFQSSLQSEESSELAKRRCPNRVTIEAPPVVISQPVTEVNQNHMQDAYMLASQQQQMMNLPEHDPNHGQGFLPSSYTEQPIHQVPAIASQVQHVQQQQAHSMQQPVSMQKHNIMDICGETFSAQSMAPNDVDSMAEYMESDYTPDPQQYRSREQESSPSSHVRCYCKPSWETSMDMRPYISDIY